jgi:hypothetical protein
MKKKCSVCTDKATRQCLCSKQLFCNKHCGEHTLNPGVHNIIEIKSAIDLKSKLELKAEILKRIEVLSFCKSQILSHTTSLIRQIKALYSQSLSILSTITSQYHSLLSSEEYNKSELQTINWLLQTEFYPAFNRDLENTNKIKEYFSQKFYHERMQTPWNKFLKEHTGRIYCVGVTNDKKTVIAGGDDLSLKLWDLASKRVKYVLEGHSAVSING